MAAEFDDLLREMKDFLKLLDSTEAAEVEWEKGGYGFRISRQPGKIRGAAPRASQNGSPAQPVPAREVVSPVVGIFHFGNEMLSTGIPVRPGQSLGYVEAVMVKHTVEAECAALLSEVHVQEGQPVEYGQLLFTLKEEDVS